MPGHNGAADSVDQRERTVSDLHGGVRLATQLPNRFDDLGHAAAIGRMVVAQSTAVGVERKVAETGDQVPVTDEWAAGALRAESQVLQL